MDGAAETRSWSGARHITGWSCIVKAIIVSGTIATVPVATADPIADLSDSVATARSSACPALRYQPAVEKAAQRINDSTLGYYRHEQRTQPIVDTVAALKESGYNASKGIALFGFAAHPDDAIHGAIVEGYAAIPDCSYTEFGVNVVQNNEPPYTMTVVVLAAPMR